eukprot:tig00000204_g17691.t1
MFAWAACPAAPVTSGGVRGAPASRSARCTCLNRSHPIGTPTGARRSPAVAVAIRAAPARRTRFEAHVGTLGGRRALPGRDAWVAPLRMRPAVRRALGPAIFPTPARAAAARNDEDYYKILGVSHGASLKEMKTAFRSAAKKLHPDVNPSPSAAEEFKRLLRAYETLSDPKARLAWEAQRSRGPYSSSSRSSSSYASSSSSYSYTPPPPGSFDSFWEDFLGGPEPAEPLDDDFGRILKDLFSQVDSKGAGSILEDFVSFFEKELQIDEEGEKRRREEEEARRRARAAAPPPPPPPPPKNTAAEVDAELAELKRRMGK